MAEERRDLSCAQLTQLVACLRHWYITVHMFMQFHRWRGFGFRTFTWDEVVVRGERAFEGQIFVACGAWGSLHDEFGSNDSCASRGPKDAQASTAPSTDLVPTI